MRLKEILDYYKEELHYEIIWDIVLVKQQETSKKVISVKEESERYWGADPFLFTHMGRLYLFYERYDRKERKGEIWYRIIDDASGGQACYPAIIDESHMSFPFIFERGGRVFLIPETSNKKCIEVYVADEFPQKWSLYKCIVNEFPAVDTIVVTNEPNKIVLYTSLGDSCTVENYELTLDGDFNLLDRKMVKSASSYGNRNAGRLFTENGITIRVGQNCLNGEYGRSLVFFNFLCPEKEIMLKEMTVGQLDWLNNKKYVGIHTYNVHDGYLALDLKYLKRKSPLQKVRFVVMKLLGSIKRRVGRIP